MSQAGVQVERHLSCPSCKRRKIKCDRKHPCSQCVVRGEEAQCQELVRYNALSLASPLDSLAAAATASSSSKRASMGPTGPTTEDRNAASSSTGTDAGASMSPSSTRLLDRMLQLEARVSRLEGGGAGPSSSSADGPKVPHSKGSAAQAEEGERHDPEAYLMVEDVAMGGRREKRARLAMDAFPSSTSSSLRSSPVPRPLPHNHTVKTPTLAPTPIAASTATLTKTKLARDRKRARKGPGASKRPRKVDDIERILALMPDAATTRILIDFYFQDLDWILKILDEDTYRAEIEAFLEGHRPASTLDAGLLACHLVILCLGFHLCSREKLVALGYTAPMATQQAATLFEASRHVLLHECRFLSGGPARVNDVACVAIMSLYQYDEVGEGQGDAAWVLLGAAIKNAQTLGLADVDGQGKGAARPIAHPHRQRARRLWWLLVWLDWSHATGHGFKYACHPEQMSTNYPIDTMSLNGEDDVAPPNLYTPNGFSIQRIRLVELYREAVDLHNKQGGTLSLESTWALDEKLHSIVKTMPSHFMAPQNGNFISRQHAFESFMLRLNVQNRFLRLHRPFQLVGSGKTKGQGGELTPSQRRCYESASAIVDLLQEASESQVASLLRMWIVSLYALGAALSLFVALCQRDSMETRQRLEVLLNLFEANKEGSQTCNNAYRLLRALRAVELSHRRVNKADEIFGKVVARFLKEGEENRDEESDDDDDEDDEGAHEEGAGAHNGAEAFEGAEEGKPDHQQLHQHLLSPHNQHPYSFSSPHHHLQHHQDFAPIHVPDVFSLDFDALQSMGLVVGDGQMTSDFDLDSWRLSL